MINLKAVIGIMVLCVLIAKVYSQDPRPGARGPGRRGGKPDFEFGGGRSEGSEFGPGPRSDRGYGKGRGFRRRGICQDDTFLQRYEAKCTRFNSTATVSCGDFDLVHDCVCEDGNCLQVKARLSDDVRCQCLDENNDPVLGFNGKPLRYPKICHVTETCDCSYANLVIDDTCTVETTQP